MNERITDSLAKRPQEKLIDRSRSLDGNTGETKVIEHVTSLSLSIYIYNLLS